jgi:hypothetical protein
MKRKLFFLFFFFLATVPFAFAQQAEIAVSSRVEIKTFSKKEIKQYQLKSDNPRTSAIIEKEDAVKRLFRDQIKNSYLEILKQLGQNQDIRFVKEFNPATTNFILRIHFSIMIDEISMNDRNPDVRLDDGSYVHGVYYMHVIFELYDPHTNVIVTMFPMYRTKFKSNNYLTPEYLFNEFWISFLHKALPRANADALSPLIKKTVGNHSYSFLKYKTIDGSPPKADGKQEGILDVKMNKVFGEAKEHSITRYKLTCEKGTFTEKNAKEIEFTGADYYFESHGGNNHYKTRYRAYNCKDYPEGEKGTDTFTLTQTQTLNGKEEKVVKKLVVHFQCEKKYTIYAYYNAPGFLKAGMAWRHSTVRFPEEGKKPQVFDVMAYQKAGGQGEPKGTDGKKLQIPYSMTLPMVGKQTFYGMGGEGEYEIPEVLYLKSLGDIPEFRLSKTHDALNSCDIVSTNGGTPHLELSIDIYAGSDGEYPFQVNIWCNNTMAKMNAPAFPIHFKVIKFTPEDIDSFKKFEKVEKTVSNGKATLKVVFEPEKSENN